MAAGDKSWGGLSIKSKGLILVAIPTAFLIAFGCLLVHLQSQAEEEARVATKARNIAGHIANLQGDVMKIVSISNGIKFKEAAIEGYKGSQTAEFIKVMHHSQEEFAALDLETRDKPEINRIVKHSNDTMAEANMLLAQATANLRSGDHEVLMDAFRKTDRLGKLEKMWFSDELLILRKLEDEYAVKSVERQAAIRHNIIGLAFLLIGMNVLLGLIFALFFVKTITSRLDILKENAIKVAASKPLHSPLRGDDEIAAVDNVFHRMATALEESARSKQDMFNMITHDIRTPLAAIQGCLELLEREKNNDRTEKLVKVAVRNSTRAMGLINDLLDSQKIMSGMMTIDTTDVRLSEIFEEVHSSVADFIAEYGIKLEIAQTDLEVLADREMLVRIIFNLISNAVKYSPQGGTIKLAVAASGSMAEISVSDQGIGIPKHLQKTIFDRFNQVEGAAAPTGSSGLGLTICKDFVTLQGGKIWVTSELKKGSTFHFTMPLA